MKRQIIKTIAMLIIVLAYQLTITSSFAQSPQKMSYQAIIRDANNKLVTNHSVGMRISIIQGSANGTAVYAETQTPTTNANGLVTTEIGSGTILLGTFSTIDWANGPYFIKTETDPVGGSNYSITGTSQILSVPYALYAAKAGNGFSGNYTDLTGKPTLANVATSGSYADLTNKPNLSDTSKYIKTEKEPAFNASIAKGIKSTDTTKWNAKSNFSGKYNDLTDKPNLADTAKYLKIEIEPAFNTSIAKGIIQTDTSKWNEKSNFSGNYVDLKNKPSIPDTLKKLKLDAGNNVINNVASPVNATDASTKAYVDALNARFKSIEDNLITAGTYFLEDIDGNQYPVAKIGTQVWMTKNLETTKFNDGDPIPFANDKMEWDILKRNNSSIYCWFGYDTLAKQTPLGAFYNWNTVSSGNLCPVGWHFPTVSEWTLLQSFLNKVTTPANKYNFYLAGYFDNNGEPYDQYPSQISVDEYKKITSKESKTGYWWSSSIDRDGNIQIIENEYKPGNGESSIVIKGSLISAYSVRCIKD